MFPFSGIMVRQGGYSRLPELWLICGIGFWLSSRFLCKPAVKVKGMIHGA